jgi:MFS family permease
MGAGSWTIHPFERSNICDRTNIGNAAVFGLQEELHLGGVEFNTALTIFFVPYILFEIPSNIFLKRLRPHVWCEFFRMSRVGPPGTDHNTVSACMFLFGLVTVCQGLVQSYSGLLATRFFLGVAETGMFPGCKTTPFASDDSVC